MIKQVIVIGGGISGLSIAFFLSKKVPSSTKIVLIEKEKLFGGWVQSTIEKDLFRFEKGPRSFRVTSRDVRASAFYEILRDLKLEDELISAEARFSKKRFLLLDKKLVQIPSSVLETLSSSLFWKALPGIFNEWFTPSRERSFQPISSSKSEGEILASNEDDESVDSFFERRFGTFIARTFADPLMLGTFGGSSQTLSVRSCFPNLYRAEKEYGSVIKSFVLAKKRRGLGEVKVENREVLESEKLKELVLKGGTYSFKDGLHSLIDSLENYLRRQTNVELMTSTSVTRVSREIVNNSNSLLTVQLSNKSFLKASHVFSAVSSDALANIVELSSPLLASVLNQLTFSSIAVVNIGYDQPVISEVFLGFGYLVPSKERQPILGVTFDSCIFPQQNFSTGETRLTVMIGDSIIMNEKVITMKEAKDKELVDIALNAIRSHLGVIQEPKYTAVNKCIRAIPQYQVGHLSVVKRTEKLVKDLFGNQLILSGNSFYGIGLTDCIFNAKKAIENTIF